MFPIAVILLIASTVAAGDEPMRPPVLDFKKQVNYIEWWNQQQRAGKEKNAFDIYQKLTIGVNENGSNAKFSDAVKKSLRELRLGEPWEVTDHPELAALIKENESQFNLLKEAVEIKDSWLIIPPDVTEVINMKRPTLSSVRVASKLLIFRSWMNQTNRKNDVLDTSIMVIRVADHWYQHGGLMDQLTAFAIESYAIESLRQAWGQKLLNEADAARVYGLLSKYKSRRLDFDAVLLVEWLNALDTLRYVCPNGTINFQRWNEIYGALPFRAKDARDKVDQHHLHLRKMIAEKPLRQIYLDYIAYVDNDPFNLKRNNFTKLLIPDLRRAIMISLKAESEQKGTMTTLALLAHKHKHGQWPESLAAIDPGLKLERLDEHKIDPITGSEFVYRVSEGKMTLYSIGVDDEDNGGVHSQRWGEHPTDRDFVFWPIPDDN